MIRVSLDRRRCNIDWHNVRSREHGLIIRINFSQHIAIALRFIGIFRAPRLRFLRHLLNFFRSLGANSCLIPIISRQVVFDFNLRRLAGIAAVIQLGVNQRQRHFRHAGRLAIACARKDDIFHARSAQGFGRLLAQYPGNGIRNIRLPATIGTDDGGHTVSMEFELGAITKRFEPENLKLLQFEQRILLRQRARTINLLDSSAFCSDYAAPRLGGERHRPELL